MWARVQQRLRETAARGTKAASRAIASPLAGKIFDADGEPLYAQGGAKAGRRYRYFVSRRLVVGSGDDDNKGWRLAAPEIERAAAISARQILNNRVGLLEALEKSEIDSPDARATLKSTSALSHRLENAAEVSACIAEIVDRVDLHNDAIAVTIKIQVPCSCEGVRTTSILNLSRLFVRAVWTCSDCGPYTVPHRVWQMAHTVSEKEKLLARVRRVRGQIEAVERAMQNEKGCAQVLQLVAAARGGMNSLMAEIIEDHVRMHVVDPVRERNASRAKGAEELIEVIQSYLK